VQSLNTSLKIPEGAGIQGMSIWEIDRSEGRGEVIGLSKPAFSIYYFTEFMQQHICTTVKVMA
jgi:hypothetical protein